MLSVETPIVDATPVARHEQLVDCPLCHRPGATYEFTTRDRIHRLPGEFVIHRCAGCNAYFIQPWLDAQGLARFTAKEVLPYHGTGRILDVGCGGGGYLYRLKQRGWETYGVEPSETGAQQAQRLSLAVRHGMLEEAGFADAFFDVIRVSNVLERLPEPKQTLRELRRILKADGLVYFTVPNSNSLVFRLFRENWYGLDAPRHVISYSPQTLKCLADATGFEVVQQSFAAGPFNFVRSLRYFLYENASAYPIGW